MNLREIRKAKGFNLMYVSRMTGIPSSTLKRVEDGQHDLKLSEAKSIAKFFKISIFGLIDREISDSNIFNVKLEKNLIKLRRKSMMIKNKELAKSLGIHRSVLGLIEKGEYDIKISLVFKICEKLNLDIEEVLICA